MAAIDKFSKSLFGKAAKPGYGKPVYFEESGDKFGTVSDEIVNKAGLVEGYEIIDDANGTKMYFPAGQFVDTERGLIFLPVWYVNAKEIVRQLELRERTTPDVIRMSPAEIEEKIKGDESLHKFISDVLNLWEDMRKRQFSLEKELENIRREMTTITEKRLLGEQDRGEFARSLLEQKRRRELVEIGIKHCTEVLTRLDRSPLIPRSMLKTVEEKERDARTDEYGQAVTQTGAPAQQSPAQSSQTQQMQSMSQAMQSMSQAMQMPYGMRQPPMQGQMQGPMQGQMQGAVGEFKEGAESPDAGPKPTKVRVLKVEGRLQQLEERAKRLDAELRRQMEVNAKELEEMIKKELELKFNREKIKTLEDEAMAIERIVIKPEEDPQKKYKEHLDAEKKKLSEQKELLLKAVEQLEKERAEIATREVKIEKPKIGEVGLKVTESYTFDNFIVGASNKVAFDSAKSVADTPAAPYNNPFYVWAPDGMGKTHVASALANYLIKERPELKVIYVTADKFASELSEALDKGALDDFRDKYKKAGVLVFEDIQNLVHNERAQDEFFHTFNTLFGERKQIIVSSDRLPKDVIGLEKRLVAKFEGGLLADIKSPELETRAAILKKKVETAAADVGDDVINYIASNITTSAGDLERVLNKVISQTKISKSKLSLEVATQLLNLSGAAPSAPAAAASATPASEGFAAAMKEGVKKEAAPGPAKSPAVEKKPAGAPAAPGPAKSPAVEKKPAGAPAAPGPAKTPAGPAVERKPAGAPAAPGPAKSPAVEKKPAGAPVDKKPAVTKKPAGQPEGENKPA